MSENTNRDRDDHRDEPVSVREAAEGRRSESGSDCEPVSVRQALEARYGRFRN